VIVPISIAAAAVLALFGSQCFLVPRAGKAVPNHPAVAGAAAMLAAAPMPAYAGGMFDFGLTLPFVAVTFLLMMVVLNALWYAPVTAEMDERNAKLLQTLSEATDMLSKADEIQVAYTEEIKEARAKAAAALKTAREKTSAAIEADTQAAKAAREAKVNSVKAELDTNFQEKVAAAGPEIEKRKKDFVAQTMAACGRSTLSWTFQWQPAQFIACASQTGISKSCSGCFEQSGRYGYDNCKSACMMGWCTAGCLQCVAPYDPQLERCTGALNLEKPTAC